MSYQERNYQEEIAMDMPTDSQVDKIIELLEDIKKLLESANNDLHK